MLITSAASEPRNVNHDQRQGPHSDTLAASPRSGFLSILQTSAREMINCRVGMKRQVVKCKNVACSHFLIFIVDVKPGAKNKA